MQQRVPKAHLSYWPGSGTFEEAARLQNADIRRAKKPPPDSGVLPLTVVSEDFWNRACEILPALHTTPILRRFVTLLLFAVHRDRLTRAVLVPRELLATVAGVKVNGKFVAEDVLKQIRDEHLPGLRWTDYEFRHGPGRVRSVTHSGLPPALHCLAEDELAAPISSGGSAIDLVTGLKYGVRQEKSAREEAREAAVKKAATVSHPGTRTLLEYLNARHPHVFTKVVRRHLDEAYAVAHAMERTEAARSQALRLLRQVEAQPVPFYGPSRHGRSARAFGGGLLALPREVREALTASWSWYDLKAVQVAIVSAQWKVPELEQYLYPSPGSEAQEIWTSLIDHMGPAAHAVYAAGGPSAARLKRGLKGLLYGIAFGMGRSSLRRLQTHEEQEDGDDSRAEELVALLGMTREEIGTRFVSHPAVRALLKARGQRHKDVLASGGGMDAFDEWVDGSKPASALAQLAQAEELFLLMPVLELASSTQDFQISAWLHDGFAITYANSSKREKWERRILRGVSDRAAARGIRTYLEPQ